MPVPAVRRSSTPDLPSHKVHEPTPPTHIQVADDTDHAAPSPARALQARLEQDLRGQASEDEGRWPLYLALPFWGAISLLMWAGIITGVWLLLRSL
jgi:hypothetical protein